MRTHELSRMVGLWLAEGSTTSKSEITFTNSQPELIKFFHKNLFENLTPKHKPRIYVYRKNKNEKTKLPVKSVVYRFYIHPLAHRPFFIYRVSGVELVSKWLHLVKYVKSKSKLYKFILQGFFAGEGNLKYIESTRSRVLRISQGKPNRFVERLFQALGLDFHYEQSERSYVISGRENLEKLWKLGISELHPIKHEKFRLMINSYKQRHMSKGQLRKEILKMLDKPRSTRELSKIFDKSNSRTWRVLSKLEEEGLVNKFHIQSVYYWVNSNRRIVLISRTKWKILRLLNRPKRVYELSKHLKVDWKSPFRRLKELEKLNLVKQKDGLWYKTPTDKEVIMLQR